MTSLAWLIPAALTLGLVGLAAFLWAMRDGQFDDLEGAGWRAIEDVEPRAFRKDAAATLDATGDTAPLNERPDQRIVN